MKVLLNDRQLQITLALLVANPQLIMKGGK